MRKLTFSINVSLDGYADHTVAIADDELHDFYTDQLDSLDTVLFGRVTYHLFESFWPLAPKDPAISQSMKEFARKINDKSKIVFSNTLKNAGWNNTKLIKGNMVDEVIKLKQLSGKSMSVGGIRSIQTLMNHSLIDEFWLLVQPVIVGQGRRLFENVNDRHNFKLVDTKTFQSGVVVLHYLLVGDQ